MNTSLSYNNTSPVDMTNMSITKSSELDYAQITVLSLGFVVCVFGTVSNSLLLHVTRKCQAFPLQHILGIGDLIFSLTYIFASPARITWVFLGMYKDKVPGFWCLLYPWVHTFNVGYVWPSVVTLGVATERFIASVFPIWYWQNWEQQIKKRFIYGIYFCLALALAPGWVLATALAVKGETTQRQGSYARCTSVYGMVFYSAQSGFGVLAGILCALLSTVALVVGKKRRKALALPANDKYLSNQRKMERTVGAIVVASLLLVALPSSFRMSEALDILPAGALSDSVVVARRYFLIMLILNSSLNFWLYIVFNSQFRREASTYILGKTTGPYGNSVAPISHKATTDRVRGRAGTKRERTMNS